MFSIALKRNTLVILAGLLLAQTGCKRQDDDPPPAAEVPRVTVEAPKWDTLKRTILQPGYTKPYEQTPIYARVEGYVGEMKMDKKGVPEVSKDGVPIIVSGGVFVDIGDYVEKGKPLAELYVPERYREWQAKVARTEQAEAMVKQAEEGLKAARANVETFEALILETKASIEEADAKEMRWKSEYERSIKLFEEKTYNKQQLDENKYQWNAAKAGQKQASARNKFALASLAESEAKVKKAAADVEAARFSALVAAADRDQAKVWYDFRKIFAPYDGIVTVRNVHPGQFLQVSSSGSTNKSAEPMFQFVNMDKLRVVVQVPEYDAFLVKAEEDSTRGKGRGSPAHIAFQGLNDLVISAPVTLTSDVLDSQSRTLRVEIHLPNLPNKDGKRELLPGMYVNATIEVETAKTWKLPLQAVFTDGDKSYCFVVEPSADKQGKAVKTALKIGVANDTDVEILKKRRPAGASEKDDWVNITGSEIIVSTNPESLLDGQIVTFAPPK
jgi:RND family efflux transporter MFP subunit